MRWSTIISVAVGLESAGFLFSSASNLAEGLGWKEGLFYKANTIAMLMIPIGMLALAYGLYKARNWCRITAVILSFLALLWLSTVCIFKIFHSGDIREGLIMLGAFLMCLAPLLSFIAILLHKDIVAAYLPSRQAIGTNGSR